MSETTEQCTCSSISTDKKVLCTVKNADESTLNSVLSSRYDSRIEALVDSLRAVFQELRTASSSEALQACFRRLGPVLQDAGFLTSFGEAYVEEAQSWGLVSIVNALLKRLQRLAEEECEESEWSVESLTDACAIVLANCSGVCARHRCPSEYSFVVVNEGEKDAPTHSVNVVVEFPDYSGCETAAMVWDAAVALGAVLILSVCGSHATPATMVRQTLASALSGAVSGTPKTIEIGCGPGLVSSVFCKICIDMHAAIAVQHFVTDLLPSGLSYAKRNVMHAVPDLLDNVADRSVKVSICTATLDVFNISSDSIGQYDVLLASDVVYDVSLAAAMAEAVSMLLRPPSLNENGIMGQSGGVALIALTLIRDGVTAFVDRITEDSRLRVLHHTTDTAAAFALKGDAIKHTVQLLIVQRI